MIFDPDQKTLDYTCALENNVHQLQLEQKEQECNLVKLGLLNTNLDKPKLISDYDREICDQVLKIKIDKPKHAVCYNYAKAIIAKNEKDQKAPPVLTSEESENCRLFLASIHNEVKKSGALGVSIVAFLPIDQALDFSYYTYQSCDDMLDKYKTPTEKHSPSKAPSKKGQH